MLVGFSKENVKWGEYLASKHEINNKMKYKFLTYINKSFKATDGKNMRKCAG